MPYGKSNYYIADNPAPGDPVVTPAMPYPQPKLPVAVSPYPVVVTPGATGCNCATGTGFEQKIKENPFVFVLGALVIGYLLSKK